MPSNLWKAESTSLELSVAGFPAVTRDLGEGPGGGEPPSPIFGLKNWQKGQKPAGQANHPPPPSPTLAHATVPHRFSIDLELLQVIDPAECTEL